MKRNPTSFLKEEYDLLVDSNLEWIIRHLETGSKPHAMVDGREVLMLNTNNYLGLATHPKIIQATIDAAKKYGNRMVYVSTDMVFDGEKGNYSEYDTPQPVNLYGKSKFQGENICLQASVDSVIVRITLQYGWGNRVSVSFSDWIIEKLRVGKQANLFTDQYRTPTYIIDTINGLEIAALHAKPNTLYHLAAPEKTGRYSDLSYA